ncbi:thioether cross-link-forming SCIFF peptide maturase [Garciella nitratireducens]|uniref:thioether cross-link-forming SCIFF peptide maturase n=1 Tax=Garciella nitratireducens TaxID=218205 RepID=UPI000DEA8FB8
MIHKFNINNMYMVLDINSGAVHLVDKITYDILDYYPEISKKESISKLQDKYQRSEIEEVIQEIDRLIEDGLLFTKGLDISKWKEKLNNQEKAIKAMCLHIAHDCNLRCKYCFASQGDFQGERSLMSQEVGRKAIDFLIKNSGNRRNLEVDFFGGEPLMNFDVVKDIVKYAKEKEKKYNKNFRFTITTNATLLTEDKMNYINQNMNNIVLSIDGDKSTNDFMRPTINGKGSYDIILPQISKMVQKRRDKDYYVRGTFTKYNLNFSKDVLHLAEQGFKEISMEPVVTDPEKDYAITEEDLPVIFKEYENLAVKYLEREKGKNPFHFFHFNIDLSQGPCIYKRLSGCGAGNEYVAITPEGEIYPCHQFVGNEDFKMGNVFSGIKRNTIQKEFKEAHVLNKDKCNNCWAKFYCSGGCHANAYNFNKDIHIPYSVGCEMEKKRIECALMIQVNRLQKS